MPETTLDSGMEQNSTELNIWICLIVIFVGNACIISENYHRNARLRIFVFCEIIRSYVVRSFGIDVKLYNVVHKRIVSIGGYTRYLLLL